MRNFLRFCPLGLAFWTIKKFFFKVYYLGGKMTSQSWQQTIVFSVVIFDAGFCQLEFTLQGV